MATSRLTLSINFKGKPCLVVGSGTVGLRRIKTLAGSEAVVDCISLNFSKEAQAICQSSGGQYSKNHYNKKDLTAHYALVVAATNDIQLNDHIAHKCKALGIPVNVASDTTLSDITFPKTIQRPPLSISISSNGNAPVLTRFLGRQLDFLIPKGYEELAQLFGDIRKTVKAKFDSPKDRENFWKYLLRHKITGDILNGVSSSPEKKIAQILNTYDHRELKGEVYLIGAGPGDPELLTLKALRLLQQSDVVLYDRLVSDEILKLISPEAEKFYVGKQRTKHSLPQKDINKALVDLALQGKQVTRLKGGDPFIFGRGGEEISLLAQHKIPFQIVPGITAASGCASYAGIPLTHRDYAQAVIFVTGYLQDGTVTLPWKQLASEKQTLAIYMGLNGLPIISQKLIEHGMKRETPAALIEQGTTDKQKVHISTIAELPMYITNQEIQSPTLMLIGDVVSLHKNLNWYDKTLLKEPLH